MKSKKTPQNEYAEKKRDSKEQFHDGLISEKEYEQLISWAYIEMQRKKELLK